MDTVKKVMFFVAFAVAFVLTWLGAALYDLGKWIDRKTAIAARNARCVQ